MSPRIRRLLSLSVLTAVLTAPALAGCGGTDAADTATRKVATERGEVKVPEHPERVAVLDWASAPALVDLDITPAAVLTGYFEGDAAKAMPERYVTALAEADRVGGWGEVSSEKLLKAKPDLIIAAGMDDKLYKQVKDIAPVADVGSQGGWLGTQERLAKVVNRTDEFDERRRGFDDAAEKLAEDYRAELTELSWASVGAGESQWFVEYRDTPAMTLLGAVGADIAELADEDGYWSDPLSYESLVDLEDTDVIIYPAGPDGTLTPNAKKLVDSRLFKGLPAVKADRAFAFRNGNLTAVTWATDALDEVEKVLKELKSE